MKLISYLVAMAISSSAISQGKYFEITQTPLSETSSVSAWKANQYTEKLEQSLSFSLQDKIVRRSEPFIFSNVSELKKIIEKNKNSQQLNLFFQMDTFGGNSELRIRLNNFVKVQGREILRGEVEGYKGSQVKLVIYGDTISGRITYPDNMHVMVIRNIENISAFYEIDVSDITYD